MKIQEGEGGQSKDLAFILSKMEATLEESEQVSEPCGLPFKGAGWLLELLWTVGHQASE